MKTRHLEQEKLLEKLTNFIQMYWDETLDLEMSDIIDQCSKSDTDFEFVRMFFKSGFGTGVLKWLRWQKLLKWVGLLKIGGKGTKEKMK